MKLKNEWELIVLSKIVSKKIYRKIVYVCCNYESVDDGISVIQEYWLLS